MRRPVSRQPRPHRRRDRHPAEFRRGARHRRYAPFSRVERSRAGAGHAGFRVENVHPVPARQLLRQDVGLQQPDPVRHSLLHHHAAHRSARFRYLPQGPGVVRGRLPRGEGPAQGAHRRSGRAPGGLQHRALQREDPGAAWHLHRDRGPDRDPRPHPPHEGQRRCRAAETGRHQELCFDRRNSGRIADQDGQARRRSRSLDEGNRSSDERRAMLDRH